MAGPASSSTASVLKQILSWSMDRPLWQRDALRRIAQGCSLNDDDLKVLAEMCQAAYGLPIPSAPAPVPLALDHIAVTPPTGQQVTLRSMDDLQHVNALAPGQTLQFAEPGLTVIYGDNGAGKSGYARVLKRACRARHQEGAVLPDAFAPKAAGPPSARIKFRVAGHDKEARWIEGKPRDPALSAVSVFDSHCAGIHVTGTNELAFTPFGLDIMEQLGSACRAVQGKLQTAKRSLEQAQAATIRSPKVRPTTTVGKLFNSLTAKTDVTMVRKLAALNTAEEQRLAQLKQDLLQDPATLATDLGVRRRRMQQLFQLLEETATKLASANIDVLKQQSDDAVATSKAAAIAASSLFKDEPLRGVGDATWRVLWEAARRYSQANAYPSQAFPVTNDGTRCVLCQAPFTGESAERMRRFEAFVQADTQQAAQNAAQSLKDGLVEYTSLGLGRALVRELVEELKIHDKVGATLVLAYLRRARWRRHTAVSSATAGTWGLPPDLPQNPCQRVTAVIATLSERITDMQAASVAAQRAALQVELAELEDRAWLRDFLPEVERELTRLLALHAVEKCIGETDTKAITVKSKAIAQEVVTDRLRDAFAKELQKIGVSSVRVELVRAAGQYGVARYKIQFIGNPSADLNIVSEGEHRCIALAAFLSELATADHRSTLVFDDPVSSLDHNYRERLAKRLVEEATVRQVIVFTHDIVFLHDLLGFAEEGQVPSLAQRVLRGHKGIGTIDEDVPWKAKKTLPRLDELAKRARAAKKRFDDGDEDSYGKEAPDIYSNLRATVERAIEEVLFAGVVLRWRSYVNLKDLPNVAVLKPTDCGTLVKIYNKCCDITAAHDPGTGRTAALPHPSELLQDLKDLEDLVREIKDRRNASGAAAVTSAGATAVAATA